MQTLEELRVEIDELDRQILELIQLRVTLAKKVQALKKRTGLPIEDLERENQILTHLAADFTGIPEELIVEIYKAIFSFTKKH